MPSSSNSSISFFQIWCTSALTISPIRSSYFLTSMLFFKSFIRPAKVCLAAKMARRPKSSISTSSYNSSPTSKSGSIFLASLYATSAKGSSIASSSTIILRRIISKSPFSAFTITSKFSSLPYFLRSNVLNTSSTTFISVGRSMFSASLNS